MSTTTKTAAKATSEIVTIDKFTQMLEGQESVRIHRGPRKWSRNAYNVYIFTGFPDCPPLPPMVMYDYNKGDGHMTHSGDDLRNCTFEFADGRMVKVGK